MNRLTTRLYDNVISLNNVNELNLDNEIAKAMQKLAAYEDTGLEPEDVSTLLKENVIMIQNGNNNTHINHVSTLNL